MTTYARKLLWQRMLLGTEQSFLNLVRRVHGAKWLVNLAVPFNITIRHNLPYSLRPSPFIAIIVPVLVTPQIELTCVQTR